MHTHENRGHILFFGGLTVAGVAAALYQWYLTMSTPLPWLLPLTIAFGVIGTGAVVLGVVSYVLALVAWRRQRISKGHRTLVQRIRRSWAAWRLRSQLTDADWLVGYSIRVDDTGTNVTTLRNLSGAFSSLLTYDDLVRSVECLRELGVFLVNCAEPPDPRATVHGGPNYGLLYRPPIFSETPAKAARRLERERQRRLARVPEAKRPDYSDATATLADLLRRGRAIEVEFDARQGCYGAYAKLEAQEGNRRAMELLGAIEEWRAQVREALPDPFKASWDGIVWRHGLSKMPSFFDSFQWIEGVIFALKMPLPGDKKPRPIADSAEQRREAAAELAAFKIGLLDRSAGSGTLADFERQLAIGTEFQAMMVRYPNGQHTPEHEEWALQWQADTAILMPKRQKEAFLRDSVFRVDIGPTDTHCTIDLNPSLDYLRTVIAAKETER